MPELDPAEQASAAIIAHRWGLTRSVLEVSHGFSP
jgi:hypothetical protein